MLAKTVSAIAAEGCCPLRSGILLRRFWSLRFICTSGSTRMAVSRAIALFWSFALTHVLALLCFSAPAVAGAVVHAAANGLPRLEARYFFSRAFQRKQNINARVAVKRKSEQIPSLRGSRKRTLSPRSSKYSPLALPPARAREWRSDIYAL